MKYGLLLTIEKDEAFTDKDVDDLLEDLEVTIRDDYNADIVFSDLKLITSNNEKFVWCKLNETLENKVDELDKAHSEILFKQIKQEARIKKMESNY